MFLALCALIAHAQQYPVRPVRMMVRYAAGGLPDTMARLMAQRRTASLGIGHAAIAQRFSALGIDPVGSTPEAYLAQTRSDIVRYARVVKAAGVKVE